jgi:3-oxoacyl-[acyl-carrier protein] reductase
MINFLSGKIAVVTGGTRGIGRAIVERLLAEGASVALCGRSADGTQKTSASLSAAGSRVYGEAADVSKPEDVRRFFQSVDTKFGGMDILINNAGIGIFRSVAELTPEDWRKTLDLNLSGVFYCSKEALARFRPRGGGYIINISSLAAKNAFAGAAAYNASKFGLAGFSEAMMLDHRYDNVRVSDIMPGSVNTEFAANPAGSDWKIAPEDVAQVVSTSCKCPHGRW